MPRARLLVVLLALIGSGCGASPSTATTAPPDQGALEGDAWGDDGWADEAESGGEGAERASAIELLGITGPEAPWAEMSADDREMYMVGKVLPIMQELFAGQDPERWNTYACETCHGGDMREVSFRMPPSSSYAVPAEGTPAWVGMERTFPEVVRFMREDVTPTMGTLLGVEGFGCHGCHPSR